MLSLKVAAIVAAVLLALLGVQTMRINALKLDAQQTLSAAIAAERDRARQLVGERDALAAETRALGAQIETLEGRARDQKHELDAAIAAADTERMQHQTATAKLAADLQKRARAAASDAEREASAAAIGVLADVYSRTDARAGIYAAEADRARLAGSVCEAQYDTARQRHQAWLTGGAEPP